MLSDYAVTCLYAPYKYNLQSDEAVLIVPVWAKEDAAHIAEIFKDAGVGIENISVKEVYDSSEVVLYLAHETLSQYGSRIKAR